MGVRLGDMEADKLKYLRPTTATCPAPAAFPGLRRHFGDLPLDQITAEKVTKWYAEDIHGSRQRQLRYGLLNDIIREAIRDELIDKNQCRIKGALRQKTAKTVVPASLDELDDMEKAMPDNLKSALLIATWCSVRRGAGPSRPSW